MENAELIQVIRTTGTRGAGTEKDPVRNVARYYTLEGEWLATQDPAGDPATVNLPAGAVGVPVGTVRPRSRGR